MPSTLVSVTLSVLFSKCLRHVEAADPKPLTSGRWDGIEQIAPSFQHRRLSATPPTSQPSDSQADVSASQHVVLSFSLHINGLALIISFVATHSRQL
jgi:hypothetical protein